jgi:hypothetical protein
VPGGQTLFYELFSGRLPNGDAPDAGRRRLAFTQAIVPVREEFLEGAEVE